MACRCFGVSSRNVRESGQGLWLVGDQFMMPSG